jgi:tRNA pseudouridine38-40 synthase
VTGPGVTVLTVGYDGGAFHGFASQPGLETVQSRLEEALALTLRRPVSVVCAGRTDAGVHALGQVVSFPARDGDPEPGDLLRSMNAMAGRHIVVSEVRRARQGFSARYDAVAREYRYDLVPGPVPPLAIGARAWWVKRSLDLSAMREGAAHLVGEHDFRSFCVSSSAEGKRTVRNIELLEIHPDTQMGEHCVTVRIVGRSFLHSMVRIIVGTLVEVGRGRRDPSTVAEALTLGQRDVAGQTAPPQGLTLWHVGYPDEYWL